MTPTDFIAELMRRFPRHTAEIEGWAPDYRRVVQDLPPAAASTVFGRTIGSWTKTQPPKPADFAMKLPKQIGEGLAGGMTYRNSDGEVRCTKQGYERAKWLARRMIDEALRHAPEELSADEASRIATRLRDDAWLAACREVITSNTESLTVTSELIARVRLGLQRDKTDPMLLLWARTGFGRSVKNTRAPSERTRAMLEDAAKKHRETMTEQPEA